MPSFVLVRCCLVAALTIVSEPIQHALATSQKQVLVLYSTRRDAQVSILGDRDLPGILQRGLGESTDFYSEYIDLARIDEPGYEAAFRDFLALKYRGQRFDLLIAIQDVAVRFASTFRDDLFPGTPLVFVAIPGPAARIPNSTGLRLELNLRDSLALALALQPDLRHVFVVSGADARDRVYERIARSQLLSFSPELAVTFLAGLPTKELEARLASLPPRSAIYYLVVNRDGTGASFHPLEYLDRMSTVASAPIYSWVDTALGHGIVGGSLKDLKAQTEAVGHLAVRVLRGEPADSIPVAEPNLNVVQVDWRQLQRWSMREARVPSGALIMFREPSVWERYRLYVLATAAIVAAQMLLIARLLVQRRRTRQAEGDLHRSQATLRRSYERIRDLGARLITAQDTERSRIARELHDDISQQVALLSIDLELMTGAAHSRDEKQVAEVLGRTRGIARSIHDLSHRLHPAKLRLIGLVSALQDLQRELARSGVPVTFTYNDVPPSLPPELTLSLFRVVQEGLQNAVKYSKADRIGVHLAGGNGTLTLVIEDDGTGFVVDEAWGKGLGLLSMSERVEAVGGSLDIVSTPGRGTRLRITVPHDAARGGRAAAV
jgi:signal transduction histidine kinase